MIQKIFYTAPKTDAIPPLGVTDKPSVVGALYFNIMKDIQLTRGYVALVDDEDFEELSKFKWCALVLKNAVYAVRSYRKPKKQFYVFMHRAIMDLEYPTLCDHKDGNGLNNQRSNLRPCSRSENNQNRISLVNGSSRFVGVCIGPKYGSNQKWRSFITVNHKQIFHGYFDTEYDAALARDNFIISNGLQFPKLNII